MREEKSFGRRPRRRADSGRVPPGALVVRRAEKSANVPENQLLKLLLGQVSAAVRGVSGRVGTGRLLSELDGLRKRADLALNDAGMRMVTMPRRATVRMRQRAERSRNWRYAEAASLQLGLEAALQQGKCGDNYSTAPARLAGARERRRSIRTLRSGSPDGSPGKRDRSLTIPLRMGCCAEVENKLRISIEETVLRSNLFFDQSMRRGVR